MRVGFFGAGTFAKNILEQIYLPPFLYQEDDIIFIDNDSELWGKYLDRKRIISPSDIYKFGIETVVITSVYEGEIRKQLMETLGISKEQIYTYEEYKRKCYANWIYQKRYPNKKDYKKRLLAGTQPIVVYTAITGNYDELKEPLFLSDGLTYVCFTDNPKIKSKIWNIEYIKDNSLDQIRLARHIKLNPHIFFSDYEISIWVDGKFQIMDDLRTYVSIYQKQSKILCFPHPERECICDELAACIISRKGNKKNMIRQVSKYLTEGYPINYGLYETGCIVRMHHDDKVKMLMENWEYEIQQYSIRDQLSIPYIYWKNNFVPDICNLDINNNRWLVSKNHLL
ncbi:MAG: DUF616 domain-containing protein [Lachnospiraceae bacterium]|nr:DUF616 domain-containing protein [Lachnospiraceae bacterium]